MENLSESNFLVYAMHNYDTPVCLDLEEFNNDLNRIKCVVRGLRPKEINVQLVLNHIIILFNVFGNSAISMLLFRVEKENWKYLIPFLIYLDRLDEDDLNFCLKHCEQLDETIINKLREF